MRLRLLPAALAAAMLALPRPALLRAADAEESPGATAPASAGPVELTDVQVGSGAGMEAIAFVLSGEAESALRREESPPRLILELPGVLHRATPPSLPEGLRLLAGLRIESSSAGPRPSTRAILELRQPAEVEVARSEGLLSVILRAAPAAEAASDGEIVPLYLVPASAGDPAAGPPSPEAPASDGAPAPTDPAASDSTGAPPRAPRPAGDAPLGHLDLLHVRVFGVEQLERRVRVAADGTIALPLIGGVPAAGLTIDGLEREIARRLADGFVKDPQVSVFVEEYRSRRVSVSGAVREPGSFEILRPTTLLEALALAGGVRADEAAGRIQVVRPDGGLAIEVDRLALQGGVLENNLALRPGDLVHVPFEEMLEVLVQGRVAHPDRYRVRRSEALTVLRAVMMAGGAQGSAGRRVEVVRREASDRTRTLVVNLNRIREGKDPDLPLEPDDIIVVR